MQDKILSFNDIGEVRFVKSRRAKKISITVKSFDDIKVSVPSRVSFRTAEMFVVENKNWIKKHIKKLKEVQSKSVVFDERTEFRTKKHTLQIRKTTKNSLTVKLSGDEILVNYPAGADIYSESVQSSIHKGIEDALRIEAKEYIPARVREFAEKYSFNFNRIFIKNIKSRWGSCSRKGNLNFSLHLLLLPEELIDYVILHELAHTVEHNHSKNFWFILDNIYGDSKAIDRKLKNYRIGFYGANRTGEY